MGQGIYATLTRQVGLLREMDTIAQNIANADTTGYRREALIFSEYVSPLSSTGDVLSMAAARGRQMDFAQGGLEQTGGSFDFAIEGEGFFQLEGPEGKRLTRAGHFLRDAEGTLRSPEGLALLDSGGVPVFVPPTAQEVYLSADGTLSADGQPVAQLGLVMPADPESLKRVSGTAFTTNEEVEPVLEPRILQGALESSNVDPVAEITRMIEVQHAYEGAQAFLDREDTRLRSITRLLDPS